jgi:hypothetical protein
MLPPIWPHAHLVIREKARIRAPAVTSRSGIMPVSRPIAAVGARSPITIDLRAPEFPVFKGNFVSANSSTRGKRYKDLTPQAVNGRRLTRRERKERASLPAWDEAVLSGDNPSNQSVPNLPRKARIWGGLLGLASLIGGYVTAPLQTGLTQTSGANNMMTGPMSLAGLCGADSALQGASDCRKSAPAGQDDARPAPNRERADRAARSVDNKKHVFRRRGMEEHRKRLLAHLNTPAPQTDSRPCAAQLNRAAGKDETSSVQLGDATRVQVSESDLAHLHLSPDLDDVMDQAESMWSAVRVIGRWSREYMNIFLDDVKVNGADCTQGADDAVCAMNKDSVDRFFQTALSNSTILRAAFRRTPGPLRINVARDAGVVNNELAGGGSLIQCGPHGTGLLLTQSAVMFVKVDGADKTQSVQPYPPGLQLLDAAMQGLLYATADAEVVRYLTDSVWRQLTHDPSFVRISQIAAAETDCKTQNEVLKFYDYLANRTNAVIQRRPPVTPVEHWAQRGGGRLVR